MTPNPDLPPPGAFPGYRQPAPPPPSRGCVGPAILIVFLIASLGINVLLCMGLTALAGGSGDIAASLPEKFIGGNSSGSDKVAVIRLEGTIMEGMLGYVHRQVDLAASDASVKAVVLRIESPGGTITASEDLLRRFEHLRDGTSPKYKGKSTAKPIVVSMGSLCASGGYYAAMAATPAVKNAPTIFAETTTITGSIGVYASLPNAKGAADKVGFKMEMIRAGDIKGSGSPFHDLSPAERQPWQDMVDGAYSQFIGVVEKGRPLLKGKLTEDLGPPKKIGKYDDKGNRIGDGGEYVRKRADGGIFMSKEALEIGLIDAIGTVDDAAIAAAGLAGIGDYRVIEYSKPKTLLNAFGVDARASTSGLDVLGATNFSPRLWFLLPAAEIDARIVRP